MAALVLGDKNCFAELLLCRFLRYLCSTMMFVLNELFQENKRATMSFLDRLISAMRPGAFLLVADSAGDFSQLEIGKKQITQPLQQEAGGARTENEVVAAGGETGGEATDGRANAEVESETEDEEDDDQQSESYSASAASMPISPKDRVAALLASVPSTRAPAPASSSSTSATSAASADKPRKKYWIYSLLDAIPSLKILHSVDSEWYRYPGVEKGLKYPLKFENMRYFVRIYQKKP